MVRDLNIVCAIATSLCNSLHWICCKCSVYLWRKHTIDVALVGVFVMHIGIVAPWCQMSLKFNFVMIYEWLALLTALYIVGIPSYLWNRQSFSFSRPIYKLFGWLIFLIITISWTILNFTIPWIHESVEALYWYRNKYDKYWLRDDK